MSKTDHLAALTAYIERTKKVLEYSSPMLDELASGEDYRICLQESFRRIGELLPVNNEALKEHFFPLVSSGEVLSGEDTETLRTFGQMIDDPTSMENIDLPLMIMLSRKILKDADAAGTLRDKILACDGLIMACYAMHTLTSRLYPERSDCLAYRDEGLKAALRLLPYLEKESFAALPDDDCRDSVLINSRYIRSLFFWEDITDPKEHLDRLEEDLAILRRSLRIADDPFYRELMPDYLWDVHVLRSLQYLADLSENCNRTGYSRSQLTELNGYTVRLTNFMKAHPELWDRCPPVETASYLTRNAYLTGALTLEDYRSELLQLMGHCDETDYSSRSMFIYFVLPIEYILTLDENNLTKEQEEHLHKIYKNIASYAYRMPKTGVLSFMLTFVADLLKHYVEVPGGISFSDMCLQLMAAMHPPTYVHSLSVAEISVFLAESLLANHPEAFAGFEGAMTKEEILAKKDDLLSFIRKAALLHDVGKLFIIETIITYGRDLLDEEFSLIRSHPETGAHLLARYPSTAPYAEVAEFHHRWFDDSKGYPDHERKPEKTCPAILAVIEAADCADAATDFVGRSYKPGKTLEMLVEEFRSERGTHYAPYVVDLFEDEQVMKGMEKLLSSGRDDNYRKTYHVLKEL